MKNAILYISLLAMLIVGCKRNQPSGAMGELAIAEFNIEVENTERPMLSANTKTSVASSKPLEVVISDESGKVVVRYASHLTMPLTTPLSEGAYTIKVQSAERFAGVRFDTPQYAATESFEIKAFEVTRISVLCVETTASVVVKYDDMFARVFDQDNYEYWSVLSSSLGDQITIPAAETKVAYFNLTNPDTEVYCQIFLRERATGTMLWDDTPSTPNIIYTVDPHADKGLETGHNYTLTIKI